MRGKARFLRLLLGLSLFATGIGAVAAVGAEGGSTKNAQVSGTITVWDYVPNFGTADEDELFMRQYPNVTVKHVVQPALGYVQLVQTALASRTAPDVLEVNAGGQLQSFIPGLEQLDAYITPAFRAMLKGSWEKVSKNYAPAQGTYAVPTAKNGFFFWFNKKLFKQAGLNPAQPPKTFPELLNAVKKLKAAGITPISMGDGEGLYDSVFFTVLAPMTMSPKQVGDLGAGRLKFNSAPVRAVFQNYLRLAGSGGANFQTTWKTDSAFVEAPNLFAAGKAGMYVSQPSIYTIFNPALGYRNVGIFQVPGIKKGAKPKFLPYSTSVGYAIPKESNNKAAAYAYARFKVSKASAQGALDSAGWIPTNVNVKAQQNAPPQIKQILLTLSTAKAIYPQPNTLWPATVQGAGIRVMKQWLTGQMTLTAMLDELDRTMAAVPR